MFEMNNANISVNMARNENNYNLTTGKYIRPGSVTDRGSITNSNHSRNWLPVAAPDRYGCQSWTKAHDLSITPFASQSPPPMLPSLGNDDCELFRGPSKWKSIAPPLNSRQQWGVLDTVFYSNAENSWSSFRSSAESAPFDSFSDYSHYNHLHQQQAANVTAHSSDIHNENIYTTISSQQESTSNSNFNTLINSFSHINNRKEQKQQQQQLQHINFRETSRQKQQPRQLPQEKRPPVMATVWKHTPQPALVCGWQNGATEADRNFARFTL